MKISTVLKLDKSLFSCKTLKEIPFKTAFRQT